ncbi:MAG TPA: hypothetical protein DCQ26_16095, partial [Marinilabiliales bacterium]|nr:hypothetical protein [Marinilabiliales bacterium]HBX86897.1 hypothetical protein [Marinilabiliales bacterium]
WPQHPYIVTFLLPFSIYRFCLQLFFFNPISKVILFINISKGGTHFFIVYCYYMCINLRGLAAFVPQQLYNLSFKAGFVFVLLTVTKISPINEKNKS